MFKSQTHKEYAASPKVCNFNNQSKGNEIIQMSDKELNILKNEWYLKGVLMKKGSQCKTWMRNPADADIIKNI